MGDMKYVYGPVPSRRLGLSLGISPIPPKTCNYSCIYCQLGRTSRLTNRRRLFFPAGDILAEFDAIHRRRLIYDVITIVGEGEPTLYLGLGELIHGLKLRTDRPVALITNGALLYDPEVRSEISSADIVLASMDAYDDDSFKRINRPHGSLTFQKVMDGLATFSMNCPGQVWLEIMLMKGINDEAAIFEKYAALLENIRYERLYLNTPIRPPAESEVAVIDAARMDQAVERLGGIAIDMLESEGFHSEITDPYKAILSIVRRHPMNQHEVLGFLKARGCGETENILAKLEGDERIEAVHYKGYITFRFNLKENDN